MASRRRTSARRLRTVLDQPRRRPPRLRIALVGPFPPARSWSAGHNAQLAEHLARYCDLDCFAEPFDATKASAARRGFRVFPAEAFGHALSPAAYDLVLYTIGPTHDVAYRLLMRSYPGVAWLHDLALADRALLARALGLVVDSHGTRARLEGAGLDSKPTWELPTVMSDQAPLVGRPPGVCQWSFDEIAQRVIEIARFDLQPVRPDQAPAPVNAPVA